MAAVAAAWWAGLCKRSSMQGSTLTKAHLAHLRHNALAAQRAAHVSTHGVAGRGSLRGGQRGPLHGGLGVRGPLVSSVCTLLASQLAHQGSNQERRGKGRRAATTTCSASVGASLLHKLQNLNAHLQAGRGRALRVLPVPE